MENPALDPRSAAAQVRGHAGALLMVSAATLVGLAVAPRWGNSAVDLLYLPAVLAAAALAGLGPALLAAIASALAYNFFFTAPHFTFRISNPNDIVTVVVLFAIALVTSQLASSIRKQAKIAQFHAERNATIAGLARRLLSCTSEREIGDVATSELASIFECNAMLVEDARDPKVVASTPAVMQLNPGDLAATALTFSTGEAAGRGLDRAVPTEWQFHPIRSGNAILAVMGVARDDGSAPIRPDQLALLDNLLDQVALALGRGRLEAETREFTRVRERDRVRSALLATIRDDLDPPLSAIGDAATGLKREGAGDRNLISEIQSSVLKLQRYLAKLFDLGSDDEQRPIEIGDVTIDLFQRIVRKCGEAVHLTPKEFAVLAELAKHPGRVLTHAHLLRSAWGPAQETQAEYLRVAIRALRQKLEDDPSKPRIIVNEPAVGYRLCTT